MQTALPNSSVQQPSQPSIEHHTHIVSQTPTRTRLRLSYKRRNKAEVDRIVNYLKQQPGVKDIQTNQNTGSMVIEHTPHSQAATDLRASLKDLGVILTNVTGIELPESGKSTVAEDFTSAIEDLNRRVGEATGHAIDLRVLVPSGLAVLALRQLLLRGWQIEAAPWYVLAYYAFDSFIKLHADSKKPEDASRDQNL